MVNHEQQGGKPALPAAAQAIPPLAPRGAARRRLAGLGVSGVLMTVASNHAMAALVCKSPSGALSGDLNSQRPSVACNGATPDYWKAHPEMWPAEVGTDDMFSKYFDCHGKLSSYSCMKVLDKDASDKNAVAMHIMATYLNVVSGRITFLTRQAVVEIWNKYDTDGYSPTGAAIPWTGDQLVTYLASTQS